MSSVSTIKTNESKQKGQTYQLYIINKKTRSPNLFKYKKKKMYKLHNANTDNIPKIHNKNKIYYLPSQFFFFFNCSLDSFIKKLRFGIQEMKSQIRIKLYINKKK